MCQIPTSLLSNTYVSPIHVLPRKKILEASNCGSWANLSTTQRYLGTVSDVEAMRWIDNLYG